MLSKVLSVVLMRNSEYILSIGAMAMLYVMIKVMKSQDVACKLSVILDLKNTVLNWLNFKCLSSHQTQISL